MSSNSTSPLDLTLKTPPTTSPASISLISPTNTTNIVAPNSNLNPTNSSPNQNNPLSPPPTSPRKKMLFPSSCRSVDNFERLGKIQEGAYGVVYRARNKETNEIVALKKLKMEREKEGFPLTSLREIRLLLSLKHPNIVEVKEVVIGNNLNNIFIVMEYLEHDLTSLLEEHSDPFSPSEIKCLLYQLLSAVDFMHQNWVLHRDLKSSNLLYSNQGRLKVADFGLAREYGSPLKPYTQVVVTLWYRAPELLLGGKTYSTAIDIWSVGCIFAELLSKEPLFPGRSELDQIDRIFKLLGTANDKIWVGFSELPNVKKINFSQQPYNKLRSKFSYLTAQAFDILNRMLTYDPKKRISAHEALNHPYFTTESPRPQPFSMMPTFPSTHEGPRKKRKRTFDDERLKLEEENSEARFMGARDRQYNVVGKPFQLRLN